MLGSTPADGVGSSARLNRHRAHEATRPNACATAVRRFSGPEAVELAILCRPSAAALDASFEAEAAYRALAADLHAHGASFADLAGETLFLRDVRRDLSTVLGARARVLADLGQSACAPHPAIIQQPPVDPATSLAVAAWAVVPRARGQWSARNVAPHRACACSGCALAGGRILHLGDHTSLRAVNLCGAGGTTFEQASNMFAAAENLLHECGMGFGDVVRTWIHLRDIGRDYDALNAARRSFFQRSGIDVRPASTGVQGGPVAEAHDVSMNLIALRSPRPPHAIPMSAPTLNEAWTYGADFSRGLRVADINHLALYISGTASVDEAGRTVHCGNFAAQADRMLDNIASLLSQQGAAFGDLTAGVAYVKEANDAPLLRAKLAQRGLGDLPCAIVEAALCRRDLLCEMEAVAVLPPAAAAT
jgi:enamine deaminase RidA (YjgF/YER057c/UK114 family)